MGCCRSKKIKQNAEPVQQKTNNSSQVEESKPRTGDSKTGSAVGEESDSKVLCAQTTSSFGSNTGPKTGSELHLLFNGSGVESSSGSKLGPTLEPSIGSKISKDSLSGSKTIDSHYFGPPLIGYSPTSD